MYPPLGQPQIDHLLSEPSPLGVKSWGVEPVRIDLSRQHGEVGEPASGIKASPLENGPQCAGLVVAEQVREYLEGIVAHDDTSDRRSGTAQRRRPAGRGAPSIGACRRRRRRSSTSKTSRGGYSTSILRGVVHIPVRPSRRVPASPGPARPAAHQAARPGNWRRLSSQASRSRREIPIGLPIRTNGGASVHFVAPRMRLSRRYETDMPMSLAASSSFSGALLFWEAIFPLPFLSGFKMAPHYGQKSALVYTENWLVFWEPLVIGVLDIPVAHATWLSNFCEDFLICTIRVPLL